MADAKKRRNGAVHARVLAHEMTPEQAFAIACRLAGAADAFAFSSASSRVHRALALKSIHDSKVYEQMGVTWEEFCSSVLQRPRRSIEEEIQTLEQLGADFFEAATQVGLSRETFRLLRRLPEGERPRLNAGVIEIGDQRIPLDRKHEDDIRDVIEELVRVKTDITDAIAKGQEQLEELRTENAALKKENKALKTPVSRSSEVTELSRRMVAVFFLLKEVTQLINDKEPGTERDAVAKWVRRIYPQWRELVAYGGHWQPTDGPPGDLTKEEWDAIGAELDAED